MMTRRGRDNVTPRVYNSIYTLGNTHLRHEDICYHSIDTSGSVMLMMMSMLMFHNSVNCCNNMIQTNHTTLESGHG